MKYNQVVSGTFLQRPNRFIAHVLIDSKEEICHVKNTGSGALLGCVLFENDTVCQWLQFHYS